ncbi:ubiquinol-cytochrome C reductase [Candidatus Uhrbacteria bacterium RIFOXYB2_FULL_45_11]|uniref:Ubiquinol-cytochrome C reductase n=1 Tax=Candidatus Uhrbacteria bacterium RIFOXYB2_FULL_45_11 TaxID=1802421 RepID=A0A1F7W554_9BACT|nr:MAG: ubiquinol-cytochrome C reductase [Candidatus Uhrbacteria bacterium RIFOXYB2_FULL_45_11]
MHHWLLKTEPSTYSWNDLVRDKIGHWDGVRNYLARNNLRAMKKGDLVFVYHSVEGKCIVGIAKVVREAYRDASAAEGDWSMVDIKPVKKLAREISLDEVKKNPVLKNMALVTHMRLSVQPVKELEWEVVLKMVDEDD